MIDPDLEIINRDDGNVFDTVDHLDDVNSPKLPIDLQLLGNQSNDQKFMSKFNDQDQRRSVCVSKGDDVFSV